MSLSRTRKRSRRRTLLDTPPRQPLTFLSAPRNPIPHQEIRPIDTPRVSLGSQRVGQGIMPLSRVPLQAIAGQPITSQPLQRVSFAKQQVSLPPLEQPLKPSASLEPHASLAPHVSLKSHAPLAPHVSLAPHAPFEPLGFASSKRPLRLQQIQLPASRLKPLAPFTARQATAKEFADDSTIPAHCPTATRLPLQAQQVEFHPVSAVQQPVITHASRIATSQRP